MLNAAEPGVMTQHMLWPMLDGCTCFKLSVQDAIHDEASSMLAEEPGAKYTLPLPAFLQNNKRVTCTLLQIRKRATCLITNGILDAREPIAERDAHRFSGTSCLLLLIIIHCKITIHVMLTVNVYPC